MGKAGRSCQTTEEPFGGRVLGAALALRGTMRVSTCCCPAYRVFMSCHLSSPVPETNPTATHTPS